MKSVLISIQPKWVEKIARGEKTIEVRKTRPKIETPFKCYIYCTKHKERLIEVVKKGDDMGWGCIYKENTPMFIKTFADTALLGTNMDGKVIGEFVCDKIIGYYPYGLRGFDLSKETLKAMCLSNKDLNEYGKLDRVYGWHISNLVIYDKPKDLGEFWTIKCTNKRNGCMGCEVKPNCIKTITRPPQSWCYVESLGE